MKTPRWKLRRAVAETRRAERIIHQLNYEAIHHLDEIEQRILVGQDAVTKRIAVLETLLAHAPRPRPEPPRWLWLAYLAVGVPLLAVGAATLGPLMVDWPQSVAVLSVFLAGAMVATANVTVPQDE